MESKHPVRYWKPNMAALPPRLGRLIIKEIMMPRSVDYSKLITESERAERELAKIVETENDKGNGNAGK
ncbi:MAG: hypothetical protein IKX30_03345 [Victivallales bacterium]|nr:hypothetical protein [Victivallales bacterium]